MPRRIRVLHIIQSLNYGGMERLLADMVRLTDPDRFESHILALRYLGRFSQGLEAHAGLHVGRKMGRYSLVRPRTLATQIWQISPHVVHTHSGVWYKASLAARMAGVPRLIHTDHGRKCPDPWSDRLLDGLAARRTDVVVAVSEAVGRQLAASVVRRPERIRVIPNGVDTDRFVPAADTGAVRSALGLAPGTPIIGSIGRLEPIKGYDVMLEAFARLRARWSGPGAPTLVVAGDGSERARLGEMLRTYALEGSAFLLGWRDDIADLHSAFTVFSMSSRSEGTSVSLLEAMSAGLCPVVTDVGGNSRVLGAALAHRLVPPEAPGRLAEAWECALRGAARRGHDAVAARARVQEGFGLEAMVARYEALYGGAA